MVLLLSILAVLAVAISREGAVGARLVTADADAQLARYVAEAGLAHARHVASASACTGYALPATPFGAHTYSAAFTPDSQSPVDILATGTLADGSTRTILQTDVPVFEGRQTVVLQPDAAAGKDAYVNEQARTRNHGASTTIGVDSGGAHDYYALLEFDLSSLPAGSVVTSAELHLYLESFGSTNTNATFTAYRVVVPWVEGTGDGTQSGDGATYDTSNGVTAWSWPGNHDANVPLASTKVSAAFSGWHQWDVTPAAAGWHEGSAPNRGLVIIGNSQVLDAFFASSDAIDATLRPKLVVTHACECGGSPSTLEIQPDATAGKDAWVYEWKPSWNYGVDTNFTVSNRFAFSLAHGLLEFDLSALPANAVVASATLGLYRTSTSSTGGTVGVRRMTSAWVEGTRNGNNGAPNWTESDAGVAWTAPGGDYAPDPHGSASAAGGQIGWSEWNVTSLVTEWHAGTPNLGLALVPTVSNTELFFASSDHADATRHPRLTIGWYCPCGMTCVAGAPGVENTTSQPAASTDDAEQIGSTVTLDSTDLQLTEDGLFDQVVGIRFPALSVPQGATVLSAYIDFTVDETGADPTSVLFRAEAVDDAAPFTTASDDITSRTAGAASVSWDAIPSWDVVGETKTTPDLAAIVQEVVDRAGWVSGNALAIGVTGSGRRTAEAWDGSPAGAPVLRVEYQGAAPPGGPPSVTLTSLADTYVSENAPGSNFGDANLTITGRDNGNDLSRSLVRFDVSGIPPGSTVLSATLRMYKSAASGVKDLPVAAHRVNAAWDEMAITWTGSGGGAFDAVSLESHTVVFGTGWETWPIPVALINEWIDGVSVNDGFILVYSDSRKNQELQFATRESADASLHPQLVIEYEPP